jgi:mono/diheme cytochrome c family protein
MGRHFRQILTVLSCCAGLFGPALAQAQTPRFDLEAIEKGRAQYQRTCAQCHGRNMITPGTTAYDLRRFPVDQPERFVQSVTQGKGSMPSFKDALDSDAVKHLWAYVGSRGGKEP